MNQEFSEKDIKKAAKGTGTNLIGNFVGKGLFFLSQLIIARFLGAEMFGIYALGFAAVKICDIFARLGLNFGGMRFVSIYKDHNPSELKGTLLSASVIPILNGALIGFVLYCSSNFIAISIFKKPELVKILQLFALGIPFLSGVIVVSSLLQGSHTTKYTICTREIVQPTANVFLIVMFHYAGFGITGVIYAFILSYLLALIFGIYNFKKLFPQFVEKNIKPIFEFRKLIVYSAPLLFMGLLEYFLLWTDTLMLGFFGSTQDVGIYRAASQVPLIMNFFLVSVSAIYAPIAADLFYKKEMQRFENLLKTTTRWVSYAAIPAFIFIIFTAREIMLLFGKGYVETGYLIVIILSFGQFINCITGSVGFALSMTGKQNISLLFSIGLAIMNIALNSFLIPKYGVFGAAIASSISAASMNLARLASVYKIYGLHPFSGEITRYLIPSLLSSLLILGLNNVMKIQTGLLMNMIVISLIFGAFYFSLMKNYVEDMFILGKVKEKLLRLVSHHN